MVYIVAIEITKTTTTTTTMTPPMTYLCGGDACMADHGEFTSTAKSISVHGGNDRLLTCRFVCIHVCMFV